jgi:hypothetical protein
LIRLAVLAAALALFVGCSSSEPKTELAARTVHSWQATVRTTAEALDHGAVPPVYARQVLRAALESRKQQAGRPEWNSLSVQVRAGLDQAIHQLAALLGEQTGGREP